LGRGLNFCTRALAEELDELFLVTTPDVPALYQTKQVIESLVRLGCNVNRLGLIVNRVPKGCEFTTRDIQDLLRVRVCSELAECAELEQAFGQGRLVAAGSSFSKQLAALVKKIAAAKVAGGKSKSSVFGVTRLLPAAQSSLPTLFRTPSRQADRRSGLAGKPSDTQAVFQGEA